MTKTCGTRLRQGRRKCLKPRDPSRAQQRARIAIFMERRCAPAFQTQEIDLPQARLGSGADRRLDREAALAQIFVTGMDAKEEMNETSLEWLDAEHPPMRTTMASPTSAPALRSRSSTRPPLDLWRDNSEETRIHRSNRRRHRWHRLCHPSAAGWIRCDGRRPRRRDGALFLR